MSARPGNWQLLAHGSDPVGGDPEELHVLVGYYKKMADTISSEAATLEQIGNGDGNQLKGESADALRKRSREVGGSLKQTSGRYNAVRDALAIYAPALDRARDETFQALQEAVAADVAQSAGNAMADPSVNRAADAPPLTEAENAQVRVRSNAISDAGAGLAKAKSRLEGALSELNGAGKAADHVISSAWHDGLVDTLAYKIKQGFIKFLKLFVKIIMWIGVALAVLAFFIPGLAALAIAGVVASVLWLAGATALAVMGEGSWLDVILIGAGVLLLGLGVVIVKAVQKTTVAVLGRIASEGAARFIARGGPAANAVKRAKIFKAAVKGKLPAANATAKLAKMDRSLASLKVRETTRFAGTRQWFNFRSGYLNADWKTAKNVFAGKGYSVEKIFGFGNVSNLNTLRARLAGEFGIATKAPPKWMYFNAPFTVYGWGGNTLISGVSPTGLNGDIKRWDAFKSGQATLTSPRI